MGDFVCPEFIPCVSPTTIKKTPDGGTAALIDDSVEMEDIHNWQEGLFSEDDKQEAEEFRTKSRAIDLNVYKEQLKKSANLVTGRSLSELYEQCNALVLKAKSQKTFLSSFCDRLLLPKPIKRFVLTRFELCSTSLMEFAPYSYYCLMVDSVFAYGIANDLIPSSKKDKAHIDIEYAYYFPFVRVFSSNDDLHIKLWKVFGDEDKQVFFKGTDLAQDLRNLESHWQTVSENERDQLRNMHPYPPVLENSLTFKAFEKMQKQGVMMPREKFEGNMAGKRTKEEEKELVDRVLEKYRYLKE